MRADEIDIEDEDQPRSAIEVAQRCIVLYAVLAGGHGESLKDLAGWLRRENLWDAVSPKEALLLESKAPTRQQTINATWRAEALLVLSWALGKVESLPPPTDLCEIPLLRTTLPRLFSPTSEFIATASLRPEEAVSEAYEVVYQAHWAIRDARINKRPLPNDDPGVIQERHHAFNWLIGYFGQDWDDVTTDT